MPEINFLNGENLSLMWSYARTLLSGVSPLILISFAIVSVGLLLGIVIKAWKSISKDSEKEDDVEIRHY